MTTCIFFGCWKTSFYLGLEAKLVTQQFKPLPKSLIRKSRFDFQTRSAIVSFAVDSISLSQSIRDDGTTLVSNRGTFELGFFSPGNSNKRYLGIWYKKIPIQTVVWVANRNNPINDSSGILILNSTGNLVLSQNDTVMWSTTSLNTPENSVSVLLESGNLVVRNGKEANPEAYIWQSFDYPCDTLLPGMKFGWDLRRGLNRDLVAWKSPDDPSPAGFSYGIALNNYPDVYIMNGAQKFYRSGPWNGLETSGSPQFQNNPIYEYNYVSNKDEIYFIYTLKNDSVFSRQVLNFSSLARERYVWVEGDQVWRLYSTVPLDYCDSYGLCGGYGICMISASPVCQCLKGFGPKSPQKWNSMDWSQGCDRNTALSCEDDRFAKFRNLKLPDTAHSWLNETMTLEECRKRCSRNCSCMAYTNSDIRGKGSGCALWFGELIDIRGFSDGQDLYVRMAASELEEEEHGSKKKLTIIIASTLGATSVLLIGFFLCCIYQGRRKVAEKSKNRGEQNREGKADEVDLPLLDFSTVATATNNFSEENKIGEGGFGPVYRGRLQNGPEIAVKRLSGSSGQGVTEFKNEMILIAKLQHRNLVKLIGCCIQGEDKLLVYEYMPNSSLDNFIFDDTKGKELDWPKRFCIICGIARGLLYLHQDSRLRIIHRDLKPSNVLLDNKLNPKISDFGIAKIFGGDQTEGNTKRIAGTYGYMAPEYAIDGLFSVKSDVFSFGILLLEIISGKKSRGFYHPNHSLNLIGHAWSLWKEGKASELINSNMVECCIVTEVLRCIHIGLLCVQQYPEDRPSMAFVVLMLGSENELPQPKKPGFYIDNDSMESKSTSTQMEINSNYELTITLLDAR